MQRNDLLRFDNRIIRILEIKDDTVLVVDCLHKSMPKRMQYAELGVFQTCTEQGLFAVTVRGIYEYDSLDQKSRRFVHEHFTLIAGVLPFIRDEKIRSAMPVLQKRKISANRLSGIIGGFIWFIRILRYLHLNRRRQKKADAGSEKHEMGAQ